MPLKLRVRVCVCCVRARVCVYVRVYVCTRVCVLVYVYDVGWSRLIARTFAPLKLFVLSFTDPDDAAVTYRAQQHTSQSRRQPDYADGLRRFCQQDITDRIRLSGRLAAPLRCVIRACGVRACLQYCAVACAPAPGTSAKRASGTNTNVYYTGRLSPSGRML